MTINKTKLQQLHARLETETPTDFTGGMVTKRDLRDLVACFIEEESAIIGETPIGNGWGKVVHLSDEARRKLNLPASSGPAKGDVDEMTDLERALEAFHESDTVQAIVRLLEEVRAETRAEQGAQSKGRECFVTVSSREHRAIYEVFEERKDAEVKACMFEPPLRVVRAVLDEPAKGGTET